MPRRHRHAKRRDELTLDRMLALTIGPPPDTELSGASEADAALRRIYELHREELLADHPPGTRPWGYWAYEPGVPAELRSQRPALVAVPHDAPSPAVAAAELDLRRLYWLALESRLSPDERCALPLLRAELERRLAQEHGQAI